jgi:hypothetical protein
MDNLTLPTEQEMRDELKLIMEDFWKEYKLHFKGEKESWYALAKKCGKYRGTLQKMIEDSGNCETLSLLQVLMPHGKSFRIIITSLPSANSNAENKMAS